MSGEAQREIGAGATLARQLDVPAAVLDKFAEPKVRDLGVAVGIEQDVRWLQVVVDDARRPRRVGQVHVPQARQDLRPRGDERGSDRCFMVISARR